MPKPNRSPNPPNEKTKGNRTKAARLLGIRLRTLQRKLKEYGQEELAV
ncbi:MAG: helix-turn-helix domain-containing protein [Rhodospirillaceae bacterium]